MSCRRPGAPTLARLAIAGIVVYVVFLAVELASLLVVSLSIVSRRERRAVPAAAVN
jgi:hypothetical protein